MCLLIRSHGLPEEGKEYQKRGPPQLLLRASTPSCAQKISTQPSIITCGCLASSSIGRAREAFGRCRAVSVISSCAKATKDLQVLESGLAWKMLTRCSRSTGGRERRSGTSQRTIPGPTKCRSKISTAMCCALDLSQRKTNRSREWLDMPGRRWISRPEGGYKCLD
jgi:hypothetical protein